MILRLKNIIAVCCLLVFTAPLVFFLHLQNRKLGIRKEMKERLETSLLQTVTIDADKLVWVKKDKEIRLGDELFDIKTITIKDGKAEVTGLYDFEERDVEKKMEEFGREYPNGKSRTYVLQILLIAFQSVFFQYPDNAVKFSENETRHTGFFICKLLQPFKKILTPPPQGLLI